MTYLQENYKCVKIGLNSIITSSIKFKLTPKHIEFQQKIKNQQRHEFISSIKSQLPKSCTIFRIFATAYLDFTTSSCKDLLRDSTCAFSIKSCLSAFVLQSNYFLNLSTYILDSKLSMSVDPLPIEPFLIFYLRLAIYIFSYWISLSFYSTPSLANSSNFLKSCYLFQRFFSVIESLVFSSCTSFFKLWFDWPPMFLYDLIMIYGRLQLSYPQNSWMSSLSQLSFSFSIINFSSSPLYFFVNFSISYYFEENFYISFKFSSFFSFIFTLNSAISRFRFLTYCSTKLLSSYAEEICFQRILILSLYGASISYDDKFLCVELLIFSCNQTILLYNFLFSLFIYLALISYFSAFYLNILNYFQTLVFYQAYFYLLVIYQLNFSFSFCICSLNFCTYYKFYSLHFLCYRFCNIFYYNFYLSFYSLLHFLSTDEYFSFILSNSSINLLCQFKSFLYFYYKSKQLCVVVEFLSKFQVFTFYKNIAGFLKCYQVIVLYFFLERQDLILYYPLYQSQNLINLCDFPIDFPLISRLLLVFDYFS